MDNTIIRQIWSLPDESIPAVHSNAWQEVIPTNFRATAATVERPVPVTERRATPEWILTHKPITQLMLAGEALLEACDIEQLRVSLANGRLLQATGTTILLIERCKNGEIIDCPWSVGEERNLIFKRLIDIRKAPRRRLNAQESYISHKLLPRCAAAISTVTGFGIKNPGTNILASGGECPISVTIGTETLHFSLDHRIYDPADAGLLYDRFFKALEEKKIC